MRKLLLALPLLLWAFPVSAASVFWSPNVTSGGGANCNNGTFLWDADSGTAGAAHKCWATATGGTTAAAMPGAGDIATFDASSGGGTVVNNMDLSIGGILLVGWTGTLDFATNNKNVTLTSTNPFNDGGTGTHTFNMGSGTWNLFFSAVTSSPIQFQNANSTLSAAAAIINIKSTGACTTSNPNVNFGASHSFGTVTILQSGSGCNMNLTYTVAITFANLTLTGPVAVQFSNGVTATVTNAFTWTGTSGNYVNASSSGVTVATIATPAASGGIWTVLKDLTFTTNTPTFSNCINLGHNTGVTCTAPAGGAAGGGVGIIGG